MNKPINEQTAKGPLLPNGVLGMVCFITMEIMFFAALISAYMIVKSGMLFWPPPGQPRLPVEWTAFNSLVLLASGWLLFKAERSFRQEKNGDAAYRLFRLSIYLGTFFVIFQGFEWIRLIGFGLTMTSSIYGGFFYLIIGAHGSHAITALIIMALMLKKMREKQLTAVEFWCAQIFWYFVVGVWPILYILLYLN